MSDHIPLSIEPTPLVDAVEQAFAAPVALLALGIPVCPSCELLKVTLGAIGDARPTLRVLLATMDSQADWDARETVLWPRDIRISRASVPVLVLVQQGAVVESRHGGGPAASMDAWLTTLIGPPERPLATGLTDAEHEALDGLAGVRANILAAKASRSAMG